MEKKPEIYFAASLFNGRENVFNSLITEGLENREYKIFLPQRDGFEFGRLAEFFSGKLPDDQVEKAVGTTIYLLDMGHLLPKKDICLVNLDESIDNGADIESSYAKLMGKFVLGYRTDVRSPYGTPDSFMGGMHFFPGFQTDYLIKHQILARDPKERNEQINSLVDKIDNRIKESGIYHQERLPDYARKNPKISSILESAEILFKDIPDIHSKSGIENITERYYNNRDRLDSVMPEII